MQLTYSRNDELEDLSIREKPNFSAPFTTASSRTENGTVIALNVHLKAYCRALAQHMRGARGRSLPGMPSAKTIGAVFRQLSAPWKGIVQSFAEDCCNAVYTFLTLAIRHVAGEYAGEALLRAYIYPNGYRFDRRRTSLEAKIKELLWPYTECHPITYHPSFNPRSTLESYPSASRPGMTWSEFARDSQYSSELIDAAETVDQTESYYNVRYRSDTAQDMKRSNRDGLSLSADMILDRIEYLRRKCRDTWH